MEYDEKLHVQNWHDVVICERAAQIHYIINCNENDPCRERFRAAEIRLGIEKWKQPLIANKVTAITDLTNSNWCACSYSSQCSFKMCLFGTGWLLGLWQCCLQPSRDHPNTRHWLRRVITGLISKTQISWSLVRYNQHRWEFYGWWSSAAAQDYFLILTFFLISQLI